MSFLCYVQPGIQHQNLQIIRNTAGSLIPPITSLFLLVCCSVTSDNSGSLQSYNDLVAYHLIDINIQPTIGTHLKPIAVTGDLASTSVSCSCDLMAFQCDTSCCCDSDCSAGDIQVFGDDCVLGGQVSSSGFDESCSSSSQNEDKLYGMLCVERDSNPNKGLSYQSVSIANNNAIYDNLRSHMKSTSSYAPEAGRNPIVGESGQQVYRSGDPILTKITRLDGTIAVGQLTLPATTAGLCSEVNPIGYLINSNTACNRFISLDSCSAASPFSVLFYLLPRSFPIGNCLPSVTVKASPNSNDISRTRHEYYCNSTTRLVKLNSAAWKFSVDSENEAVTDRFVEHELCGFAEGVVSQNVPLATRFNNKTGVCENVIRQVEYEFYWHAGSVVAVRARYLIANISLTGDETSAAKSEYSGDSDVEGKSNSRIVLLSQQFSVKFIYITEKVVENFFVDPCISCLTALLNLSATYAGNPGYSIDISGPLQSGLFDYGSNEIDTNFTNQLRVWKSSGDSSCSVVGRQPVLFGQDTLSGCLLTVTLEELRYSCDTVRQRVRDEQTAIVAASHVGRYATSDPMIESDWVEILK